MFSGDESFVPDGLVEVLKKKMNKEDAMPLAVINPKNPDPSPD